MKIALAAVGFVNGAADRNKETVKRIMAQYNGKADMVVFGEAFLQGFDALSWDYERDRQIAVSLQDPFIQEIRQWAKACGIAVSFGYAERDGDALYSGQLTVGADGEILDTFRRVSVGWKTEEADGHYREGSGFARFSYRGRTFAVGLCGDLWYEDNIAAVKQLGADAVLWPVYTDYSAAGWNTGAKFEYAEQAAECGTTVLYVNSVCLNPQTPDFAHGGAAVFRDGKIVCEIPSGKEGVLLAEL